MRRRACIEFALDGVCHYGERCKFAHPSQEVVRGLCRRFLRGECRPESHCRMAHDVPVEPSVPRECRSYPRREDQRHKDEPEEFRAPRRVVERGEGPREQVQLMPRVAVPVPRPKAVPKAPRSQISTPGDEDTELQLLQEENHRLKRLRDKQRLKAENEELRSQIERGRSPERKRRESPERERSRLRSRSRSWPSEWWDRPKSPPPVDKTSSDEEWRSGDERPPRRVSPRTERGPPPAK